MPFTNMANFIHFDKRHNKNSIISFLVCEDEKKLHIFYQIDNFFSIK